MHPSRVSVVVSLVFAVFGSVTASRPHRRVRYRNFEDYLLNTVSSSRARGAALLSRISDDEDFIRAPGSGIELSDGDKYDDVLDYYRDVPRSKWPCCMLGKIAGDKGFHCHTQFYRAEITYRNRNRAHNKAMHFYGRDRIPRYGKELMYTFQKCVSKKVYEFHKCCTLAARGSLRRNTWNRHSTRTIISPYRRRQKTWRHSFK